MEKALPIEFLKRMQKQLGDAYPAYLSAMKESPRRGLRVNLLRIRPEEFENICPWALEKSPTLSEGYLLKEEVQGIGSHPYHMAGLFYMQEPSAMGVIELADPKPGMRVLDLCAAPGGKAGGLGARMAGEGLLVANEIVPNRARILLENLQRLGLGNSVVTNAHPEKLCEALREYFDLVVVDAPCSGEGMFRKDPGAIEEWSEAHVRSCAERQRAILESADRALAAGGSLVYSTCTFSPEENELQIEDFLKRHPAYRLGEMKRSYPHNSPGEGHFMARLEKTEGERRSYPALRFPAYRGESPVKGLRGSVLKDGRVQVLPESELPAALSELHLLSAGVAAGEEKNGRFLPDHALAMAMEWENRIRFSLSDPRLPRFLHGETVPVEASLKGFVRVELEGGWPLGFGKAVDGTLKNHLPKKLRI